MITVTVTVLVTAVLLWILIPVLARGVLDVPNARSSHTVAVPRGGGVAVAVGSLAGWAASWPPEPRWPVLVAGGMACAGLGFSDDLRGLRARTRLVTVAVLSGVLVLAYLPDGMAARLIVALVAALAITAYVNAFNFMDGINGISGLIAVVTAAWLAWRVTVHAPEQTSLIVLGLAVAAAAAAFVPFNLPVARVFLGDVGSYYLGFVLGGIGYIAWTVGVPLIEVAAPFCVYLADTGVAIARRVVGGKRLSEPHRDHVYQQLVDSGRSQVTIAVFVSIVTVAVCGSVLVGMTAAKIGITSALLAAYLAMPWIVGRLDREGTP